MTRRPPRTGQIYTAWLAFLASAVLLVLLIGFLLWNPEPGLSREPLVVYCAAGIKGPVEAIARQYEKDFGIPVQLQYGGSNTLLANLEVSKRGDLFLPADDSYLQIARAKGLVEESIPLARMKAVLAVRQGNPKKIEGLEDVLTKDIRLAQANPEAAAVGKLTRDAMKKIGLWAALKKKTLVFKPTVNDVAGDILVGTVDAGIVWDANVRQMPELEMIPLPQLAGAAAHISLAVLHGSEQPTSALRFARYLAAQDKGLSLFEGFGFQPVEGDSWAEVPEIRLMAGAMLQPAIEETISQFEQREGVKVVRVYNGCGILVAQMRAGAKPDAYFACDQSFMKQVNDLFLDQVDISTNQLVILVPKGNPKEIKSLKDLAKPGLRVGIGHEKQCALGVLTQETLAQMGFKNDVMKNVTVQTPTGDMLVNQIRTGSLDAVVAYISNAVSAADQFDAIKINIPCAIAVQPFAIGKESSHKHLTSRLLATLRSQASKEQFESNGFHWQAGSR